jgi:hypothetical protein
MRKVLLAGAAVIGLALAPAHADEIELETKVYDLSAVGFTISGAVNIGGTIFAAPGLPVTRVVALDETGTPAPLQIAQDFNNNLQSGETGEPSVVGCGEVDLTDSAVAFDPSKQIAAFVSTVDIGCVGSVATTGTLTLYGLT